MTPAWVGPTVAISLVVIAISFLLIGAVALIIGLGLRKANNQLRAALQAYAADAKAVTARLRGELEGFTDLTAEARRRLQAALDAADGRLKDLDALAEVLQDELEDTALDVAAFVRTLRRPRTIFGAARALRRRGR